MRAKARAEQSATRLGTRFPGLASFEVLFLSDMTRRGDAALRIAGEVVACADAGYRTGLLHLASPACGDRIAPEIQRCVREGKAEAVDPSQSIEARLLIIHAPHLLSLLQDSVGRIAAERVIAVAERAARSDLERKNRLLAGLFRSVVWAPANHWVRAAIKDTGVSLPLTSAKWPFPQPPSRPPQRRPAGVLTLGWLGDAGAGTIDPGWQTVDGELRQALLLGQPPPAEGPSPTAPAANAIVVDPQLMATGRFVGKLDLLAYFPAPVTTELWDASIATAMARGVGVILPRWLRRH